MAWRLQDYVTRGEIDNRTRGRVTGCIWLAGVDEPLVLELKGNCHPDLAGCLLSFENRHAIPLTTRPPVSPQRGRTGEMTASRKVRVPDVPLEEFFRLSEAGLPAPEHLANYLYLEWFNDSAGRVVIESADFRMHISAPEWRLSPEERAERPSESSPDSFETASDVFSEALEDEDNGPWDEFRHEQALRESDALTDKFGKLFEKYRDHPERDQIIAREMGWEWLEENADGEATDYDDAGPGDDLAGPAENEDSGEWVKPEPDPAREGIDWIRTSDGEIRHPLYDRAFNLIALLHGFCRKQNIQEEEIPELEGLFSQTGLLAAKLAGALTDLADGTNLYEPGFVVALLKRALEILNQVLAALDVVEAKSILPGDLVVPYRAELLSIREGMLTLIQEFRRRIC